MSERDTQLRKKSETCEPNRIFQMGKRRMGGASEETGGSARCSGEEIPKRMARLGRLARDVVNSVAGWRILDTSVQNNLD